MGIKKCSQHLVAFKLLPEGGMGMEGGMWVEGNWTEAVSIQMIW